MLRSDAVFESSCNGNSPDPSHSTSSGGAAVVIDVALVLLVRFGGQSAPEVLVTRRPIEAIRGGLFEYPGGKVERGETPSGAAMREAEEELGLVQSDLIGELMPLIVVVHTDPELARERSVRLHAFVGELASTAQPEARAASELRFVPIPDLLTLSWPAGNAAIHRALAAHLARGC